MFEFGGAGFHFFHQFISDGFLHQNPRPCQANLPRVIILFNHAGYGYPLHNFYAPGWHIIAGGLYSQFGGDAVHYWLAAQAIGVMLAGVGAYLFARTFAPRYGALIAAAAFTWDAVPYHPSAKYISVIRDPKDVFVSSYYFIQDVAMGVLMPSVDIWLELYLSSSFMLSS